MKNPKDVSMIRLAPAVALASLFLVAASPVHAEKIFVSNEKDNTVTVIDGKTLQVIKTIPTARRPRGIIANPSGKEVYVAAGDGDIMDVIDTEKLAVTRTLDSGPDPSSWPSIPRATTSTSPMRTIPWSRSWTSRAATCSPRFRWAWSPKAWA
jgi:YVTN family beta-propeller protein